jgi:hypothetical protein
LHATEGPAFESHSGSCRKPGVISEEYSDCPCMSTVGRWRQQTIHSAEGVAAQRQVQLEDMKDFRLKIKPNKLYAAYASYREELGGRPYWLLRTR